MRPNQSKMASYDNNLAEPRSHIWALGPTKIAIECFSWFDLITSKLYFYTYIIILKYLVGFYYVFNGSAWLFLVEYQAYTPQVVISCIFYFSSLKIILDFFLLCFICPSDQKKLSLFSTYILNYENWIHCKFYTGFYFFS